MKLWDVETGEEISGESYYYGPVAVPETPAASIASADVAAPQIVFIEPRAMQGVIRLKTDQLLVKGLAEDESGVYRVTVNGQKAKMVSETEFQALVPLKVGDNLIVVEATDIYNNKASQNIVIQREAESAIIYAPAQPVSRPKSNTVLKNWYDRRHALVVGIDSYENPAFPLLRNAVRDARSVASMFRDKLDFEVVELYDAKATRKAIIRAFSQIAGRAGKQDGFVFYFAGHGQGIRTGNSAREGYILPWDADVKPEDDSVILFDEEAISLNRLRLYAQDIEARHTALILDSCFSGLAMKRTVPSVSAMSVEYYEDLLSRRAINILTAGDDQPVSDGSGQSPFTSALLNALDRKALDLHDRDGFATFSQLALYVKEKVEKATGRRQRPQFDNLSLDDGEFVFRLR